MGLRILSDPDEPAACLWDSVSGWAFGPVFEGEQSYEDASAFIEWLPRDARVYDQNELEQAYSKWRAER